MSWHDDAKAHALREASDNARTAYEAASRAARIAVQERNRLYKIYRSELRASVEYNETIDPLPPLKAIGEAGITR